MSVPVIVVAQAVIVLGNVDTKVRDDVPPTLVSKYLISPVRSQSPVDELYVTSQSITPVLDGGFSLDAMLTPLYAILVQLVDSIPSGFPLKPVTLQDVDAQLVPRLSP